MIASIATTSFDGARRGRSRTGSKPSSTGSPTRGFGLTASLRLTDTSSCCSASPGSASSTCSASAGCGPSRRAPRSRKLRVGFAHTLIPIALAYLVAHYFSLFVFQEQAQFTYLLSDPLGTGTTDLFGTASSGVDYTILTANAIWYVQVAALSSAT